jgi:hypothetical protein
MWVRVLPVKIRLLFLLLLALDSPATAAPQALCPGTTETESKYTLGLVLQAMFPSHLPDSPVQLPMYGPRFEMPMLGNIAYAQVTYGAGDPTGNGGTSIILSEVGYQLPIDTPFFLAFAEAGVHYLHYAVVGKNHEMPGGHFGLGLTLPMGKGFQLGFGIKSYLQFEPIFSFGGSFSFAL